MKNKSQPSRMHSIIVIIVVVALISTLGFLVWQNFIQKNLQNTGKEIIISEWSIKGKYKGSLPIKYTYFGFDININVDSTDACSLYYAGSISRYSGDKKLSTNLAAAEDDDRTYAEYFAKDGTSGFGVSSSKHIGNYYYIIILPNTGCYDSTNPEYKASYKQAAKDVLDYFNTLEAI